jgi:hypothetical protein
MSISRLLVTTVLMAGLACHKHPTPPKEALRTGSATVPTCRNFRTPCVGLTCGTGGNSAYTNVFPVNGLNAAGTCNGDEIQLLPDTLNGGRCGSGASLTFDTHDNTLVGKNGNDECRHDKLQGATFQVRSGQQGLPVVTLTIAKVDHFNEEGVEYEGYRIVDAGGSNSLCDYTAAAQVLTELGFGSGSGSACPPLGSSVGSAEPYADLVAALPGPIYNQTDGSVIPSDGSGFFNLACAQDALAKTAFYKINGSAGTTTAALRMITARYGGSNQPYTVRGIPITVQQDSTLDSSQLVPEAKWDDTGKAMCLSTPRLTTIAGAPQSIPGCLDPTGSGSDWTSKLRSQLGIGSCSDFGSSSGELFRSWTGGDGAAVLTYRHK